jgi:polysaccharide export outer membrane protein
LDRYWEGQENGPEFGIFFYNTKRREETRQVTELGKLAYVFIFLIATALPLSSQGSEPSAQNVIGAEPQAFFDSRTLLAVTNPDYPVSPGDVYTLTYNREQVVMTQYLIVEPDLTVDLSVFGVEDAADLTFMEFKRKVESKVRTAYPKSLPRITIRSTGVFEVLLKGEVLRTGYKLAWGLTRLSEIVSENLTPYSSTRNIQIVSSDGRIRSYDLYRAFRGGEKDQDPFVRPRDTIILRKYDRQISIDGEVERPGTYQLLSGDQLEKVIEYYGSGMTPAADPTRVELNQYNSKEKVPVITYVDITQGYDRGILLENGDSLYVPSRTELLPIVYFEGAIVPEGANPQEKFVIYRQKHNIRRGETLYTALRSIVLSPQADLAACYIKRNREKIFIALDDYLYNYKPNKDVVLKPLDCIVIPYIR